MYVYFESSPFPYIKTPSQRYDFRPTLCNQRVSCSWQQKRAWRPSSHITHQSPLGIGRPGFAVVTLASRRERIPTFVDAGTPATAGTKAGLCLFGLQLQQLETACAIQTTRCIDVGVEVPPCCLRRHSWSGKAQVRRQSARCVLYLLLWGWLTLGGVRTTRIQRLAGAAPQFPSLRLHTKMRAQASKC